MTTGLETRGRRGRERWMLSLYGLMKIPMLHVRWGEKFHIAESSVCARSLCSYWLNDLLSPFSLSLSHSWWEHLLLSVLSLSSIFPLILPFLCSRIYFLICNNSCYVTSLLLLRSTLCFLTSFFITFLFLTALLLLFSPPFQHSTSFSFLLALAPFSSAYCSTIFVGHSRRKEKKNVGFYLMWKYI